MHNIFSTIILVFILVIAETACSGDAASNSEANGQANADNSAAVASPNAQTALAEGTKLLEDGDTEKAIDLLLSAVSMDPDLGDAYFQLGIAYSLVEKRDAGAVEADATPTPAPGAKKPKEVKTESEKAFEKAVAAYKKHLTANPEDAAANFNLGRAYNKLNEDEDAAKALKNAVKLNPEDTEYQTELGAIFIKLAQYREAIPPLRKALEIDPANTRAEELLSDAEAGRKRIDYSAPKSDDKKNGKAANSNSNAVDRGSNGNSKANTARPTLPPPPRNRPE